MPFTNYVDIVGGTYKVNNKFQQKLSHYHTAVLPMYDKTKNAMYTLFLGGIAQYYPDNNGKIISNKEVPFTKTISLISRVNGKVEETYLPLQMPGYLGTAAEFIFAPDAIVYKEGIADFNLLPKNETLIGYIVGGINSSDKNIFFTNTGKESKANNTIIKVYLKRNL
ncbi:MAG: hypothetical protein KAF41_10170 [Flavobacterium sp.]|nr:hypothetical protein [Flavobacterium sp.]